MSEWRERYRLYEQKFVEAQRIKTELEREEAYEKCVEAQRIKTELEREEAYEECEKIHQELMASPDRPDSPQINTIETIEQLVAWCDNARSNELFPFQLREVHEAAEDLGIRVMLPKKLPTELEVLNAFAWDQELMDRWKNIVFEFIESIRSAPAVVESEMRKGKADPTPTKTTDELVLEADSAYRKLDKQLPQADRIKAIQPFIDAAGYKSFEAIRSRANTLKRQQAKDNKK